ncbi:MAG: hypothetical protein HFE73_00230 [Firmicutes bacterium]|nr:hypothetical protein [Bacillota bacterium]
MKSRDEFLDSIYAKQETALSQRRVYKKRFFRYATTAAACIMVMVGIARMDALKPADDSSIYDMAAPESYSAMTDGKEKSDAATVTEETSKLDSTKRVEPGTEQIGEDTKKEIEDKEVGSDYDSEIESDSVSPEDQPIVGWYCLPVAIEIEDKTGKTVRYHSDQEIFDGMEWIHDVCEQGIAISKEKLTEEQKTEFVYKVTAVYSMPDDPDSWDSDRIYYIFQDVEGFWKE